MRRAAPVLLCLLLVLSGVCTSLCAAPPPDDSQHPCCPHHQNQSKSCGHVAPGQDSQAIVKQVSSGAPLALLPQPRVFTSPLMAFAAPAPSAVIADFSSQRHFVLRL
jgi:hypothetical protein